MSQVTAEHVGLLRRFATQEAARTRRGRRWLELLGTHQQELLHRYAASPTLRERTEQVLATAAALVESIDTDRPRVVDAGAIAAVEAILTELDTQASADLRQATGDLRRDVHAVRGKTIREALGPHDT